jgi:hypothetical protein
VGETSHPGEERRASAARMCLALSLPPVASMGRMAAFATAFFLAYSFLSHGCAARAQDGSRARGERDRIAPCSTAWLPE